MKISKRSMLCLLSAGILFGTTAYCNSSANSSFSGLRVKGSTIVDSNGKVKKLRGVNLTNTIFDNNCAGILPTATYSEADYVRFQNMGCTAIRFLLNYSFFENDAAPYSYKQSGWDWLNNNILWATKHNIYLIFNMHVPQGGFQSTGTGTALWDPQTNNPNQARLKSLWKAIASRYKDEPIIAGFGLVNEPLPKYSWTAWRDLSTSLVKEIRSVDSNHIIIIERPMGENNAYSTCNTGESNNFFLVNDPNIVYEFHCYEPWSYCSGGGSTYPSTGDNTLNHLKDAIGWSTAFQNAHSVPVYLGEFGCVDKCFSSNLGGLQYISDMIDLGETVAGYTLWQYHGPKEDFRLYVYNWDSAPITTQTVRNQPLIDLITQKYTKLAVPVNTPDFLQPKALSRSPVKLTSSGKGVFVHRNDLQEGNYHAASVTLSGKRVVLKDKRKGK